MMSERVVITGMGTVNPLGLSASESWGNAVAGVSGIGPLTRWTESPIPVYVAGEVKNFNPEQSLNPKEVRRRDRYEWYAAAATQEAIRQAGLVITEANAGRVGVVYGSAVGGSQTLLDQYEVMKTEGPRRVSPFTIPMFIVDGASGMIALDLGCRGPALAVVSACASGGDALGMAWMMIRAGMIDAAVAGAADASLVQIGVAAFDRVGAVCRRTDPAMAPQPFDKNRDGLVVGEGAATLVLESESHARQRGATILAELAGYGATADAFHVTAPREDGSGGAEAIRIALRTAGLNLEDVSYINAHGTATPLNDVVETRAIKAVFGKIAYNIPISSTKSMTGHMMGATGALEAIFCVQAIREGVIPPTIHYQTPDPDCDLDYVPNQARQRPIKAAISNAFGFGGHNSVIAVKEYR
jgi:beta-ketoacyl-acyl-carrier-protein synthase II